MGRLAASALNNTESMIMMKGVRSRFGMTTCLLWQAAMVAGCASSVTAIPLHPPPRPVSPHGFESVTVYSGAAPLRPHVAVAQLNLERTSGLDEQATSGMVHRLRESAGALGCDGVVVGPLGDPDSRSIHATCIVYK
jgi:hypothetical protein